MIALRYLALLCLFSLWNCSASAQAPPQRVWIAEFATARVEAAPVATLPAGVVQPVIDLSSGTAKRSATFGAGTRYIRVVCEVQCALTGVGNATTSSILLPKLTPEYFLIAQGLQAISIIAAP